MRNPISVILNSRNKNNESTIIHAIAQQSQIDPVAVEKVLKASYQITENANTEIIENQEDLYNTFLAENRINKRELAELKKGLKQVNDKQKITNIHLSDIQKLIERKAEKAAKGTEQTNLDEIMFGNMTTEQLFNRQQETVVKTREYKKQLGVYKRRIWYLIKLHMNDVYGTSRSKRKEDFQDYMFTEIQDYVKELSVYEIRRR